MQLSSRSCTLTLHHLYSCFAQGKTLVAVLPAYLNALSDNGVHVVTVNDYLARRDSEWVGQVHRFLGLKVCACVHACLLIHAHEED